MESNDKELCNEQSISRYFLMGGFFGGGILPEGDAAFSREESDAHRNARFQGLHQQFVASALTEKLGHAINPNFKIGCMIAGSVSYPLTCHPSDVIKNQKQMQIRNYLCGDSMVRGYYPSFAQPYFKENNISFHVEAQDDQILREGTVDFYAFSYYATGLRFFLNEVYD